MSIIYLVRHGQASIGKSNYDNLSDKGKLQSETLGRSFRDRVKNIDVVQLGTLKRHQQTFESFNRKFGIEGNKMSSELWNEYNHLDIIKCFNPKYEKRWYMMADMFKKMNPKRDFINMFYKAMNRWMSGEFDDEYMESWPVFQKRCNDAINGLAESLQDDEVAVVITSGGVKSAIVQRLLNLPNEHFMKLNTKFVNCSVTKIISTPNEISVSTINDYSHFERNREFITYI